MFCIFVVQNKKQRLMYMKAAKFKTNVVGNMWDLKLTSIHEVSKSTYYKIIRFCKNKGYDFIRFEYDAEYELIVKF